MALSNPTAVNALVDTVSSVPSSYTRTSFVVRLSTLYKFPTFAASWGVFGAAAATFAAAKAVMFVERKKAAYKRQMEGVTAARLAAQAAESEE
eukprot:gnl/Spiro4/28524_TR14103_c0_g1_i1.p2 gnl/Spiro4/28524_TR14103_c0_g1~~gnl/Spiro4/28524_TR14103_c0_g1_i1.p2  ORF type:complete len:106 (+),score=31.70 gnl/Spiro4/28524_TR14103_c0_g1_i1:42-320(+)